MKEFIRIGYGSKTDAGVGFSVVQHNSTISRSLPPQCSIYTAELRAILTAVSSLIRSPYHHYTIYSDSRSALTAVSSLIRSPYHHYTIYSDSRSALTAVSSLIRSPYHHYTIYSDSRSALTAVCDSFSPHPLVMEIHRWLSMLHSTDKLVEFCWVPSHVGVRENEEADRAARDAANSGRNPPPIPVPRKDFSPVLKLPYLADGMPTGLLSTTTNYAKLNRLSTHLPPPHVNLVLRRWH